MRTVFVMVLIVFFPVQTDFIGNFSFWLDVYHKVAVALKQSEATIHRDYSCGYACFNGD